ncbi:MAG TPA: GNAT family N-acetyltransferase, partial [Acidimicrobiia bacterium]|nr:GNAT family N-acetyltransferase [Acidimicrobiia bacterium]
MIHRLHLTERDEVFHRFRPSQVQRNIRRAERDGVQVHHARGRADVDRVFYSLHVRTRRRQGVPVQPRRFFSLLAGLLETGLGFASLAYIGDRPVAGA